MQKLESSRQAGQEISTKWAGCESTHTFSSSLTVSSDTFELFLWTVAEDLINPKIGLGG